MEGLFLAVAAVIVTHNSEPVIGPCLEALAKVAPSVAAVVVDNASADLSVERARRAEAHVIPNPDNRGFAAAVNQGFRATSSEFVLLLNPDVLSPLP